ncbi:MAG: hypothetical protein IIA87_01060 [Nanoarchaeota archaeon]|nr:hypothetical protein [Nanoarchaeota archaeon]
MTTEETERNSAANLTGESYREKYQSLLKRASELYVRKTPLWQSIQPEDISTEFGVPEGDARLALEYLKNEGRTHHRKLRV